MEAVPWGATRLKFVPGMRCRRTLGGGGVSPCDPVGNPASCNLIRTWLKSLVLPELRLRIFFMPLSLVQRSCFYLTGNVWESVLPGPPLCVPATHCSPLSRCINAFTCFTCASTNTPHPRALMECSSSAETTLNASPRRRPFRGAWT